MRNRQNRFAPRDTGECADLVTSHTSARAALKRCPVRFNAMRTNPNRAF
jgi:hypothetical protein